MADVYEQNLPSKANLTTNDYIRVVGSDNNSYKQLVSDVAKKIIENYTGSSLAGSSQSVKSALDSLNSKTTNVVSFGSFSSNADAFKAMCNSLYNNDQYATTFGAVFTGTASGTYIVVAVVTASAVRFIASYAAATYVGQHIRSNNSLIFYKVDSTAQ